MPERLSPELYEEIKYLTELDRARLAVRKAREGLTLIIDYSHNIELSVSRVAVKAMAVETLLEIDQILHG